MNKQVQQVKKDVAANGQPTPITKLIEQNVKKLGQTLPKSMSPERLVRIAMTTLRKNPLLTRCVPESFLGALFQCAQLGLEPDVEGQAYIIPYQHKNAYVAQFQIGFKGLIDLFWRHPSALSLQMETVREHDQFSMDLGQNIVKHIPPMFGEDRGDVIGYYAVATLKGGGRVVKVMSKHEAFEFGKKFTKCWDHKANQFKAYTPWASHFDAMAQKTVLKQLMKLLPKSVDFQKALSLDETVKTEVKPDMADVPDSMVWQEQPPEPAQEGLPEPQPAGKKTMIDIKIHQMKKELGEESYYKILGTYGCEKMTQLTAEQKPKFLHELNQKKKELAEQADTK